LMFTAAPLTIRTRDVLNAKDAGKLPQLLSLTAVA